MAWPDLFDPQVGARWRHEATGASDYRVCTNLNNLGSQGTLLEVHDLVTEFVTARCARARGTWRFICSARVVKPWASSARAGQASR